MAEKIEFPETIEDNVNILLENGRKVFLASLGAFAMAQEEMIELFNNLVERGTNTEQKTRNMVNDRVENQQKMPRKVPNGLRKKLKTAGKMPHFMNIPSKNDIDKLNRKVTTSSRKLMILLCRLTNGQRDA
ncbi:MAG: phasin family protein [Ardenticatenaceae bacterium]|nr:phasin family protein [Ardenticatenaceae bacterium]